jgi:hypothetical protein
METWVPADADVRADMARLGWTIAFATAALLGAHLWNPLNLDLRALVPPSVLALQVWALIVLTLLAVVASVQLSLGSEVARSIVGVLGGVVTLFVGLGGLLGVAAHSAASDEPQEESVVARRGWSELVVVQRGDSDPEFHVELRRGLGPFRQMSVVWDGRPGAPGPGAARFLGPGEVAVSVRDRAASRVCDYVVPHGLLTLEPDRVLPGPRGTEGC